MRHAPKGPLKAKPSDLMDAVNPVNGQPQCTARSKQSGVRCKRRPTPGCTVCRMHGGAAPQVRAAGLERLRQFQERAIDRLCELAEQHEYPSTAYQAVRDVLDRTMGKPAETVALTGSGGGPLQFQWLQSETADKP